MKTILMPYLLLAYIFSMGVLSCFAAIGVVERAYDPGSTLLWMIGFIVINILSFVYTVIWGIDIAEARMKKEQQDDAE